VYCGTVGYLAPAGSEPRARFSVPIRTVVLDAETGSAEYGVGGGITWDSRAAGEYDEIVAKARVLNARRPRFSLLETLRYEPGEGFARLEAHLGRLVDSATYFGFPVDVDEVRAALDASIVGRGPARVRLLVDRSGRIETGVSSPPVTLEPVWLTIDRDQPVDPSDVMLFHKTSLRARYDEASVRHPDADDVILINERGEVTETTRANLAVELDGRWWTPALDAGLLPGVERAALLNEDRLVERRIAVEELSSAGGLAIVNSVRGWCRAKLTG
jgi:para-aminobenzoate synthetase/4-amino-4-deoxychorismate lyase